jgi:hypothetical protein
MRSNPWFVIAFLGLIALPFVVIGWRDVQIIWPDWAVDKWAAVIAALAASVSAYFAATIWTVHKGELEHARQVDRAYVSGGGPGNTPHGPFVLTIDNYGRTPATLIEYAVDFCEVTAIPREPTPRDRRRERSAGSWRGQPDPENFPSLCEMHHTSTVSAAL